jgi:hypothetical protein
MGHYLSEMENPEPIPKWLQKIYEKQRKARKKKNKTIIGALNKSTIGNDVK